MIEELAQSCPQHVKDEINAMFAKNAVHHDFTQNCNKLARHAEKTVKHVKKEAERVERP